MKVKAKKINNPDCDYLTEGKVYKAIPLCSKRFIIPTQYRNLICLYKNCQRINGNWTIITDKAKVR